MEKTILDRSQPFELGPKTETKIEPSTQINQKPPTILDRTKEYTPIEKPSMGSAAVTAGLRGLSFETWNEIKSIFGAGVADYIKNNPEALKKYETLLEQYTREQEEAEKAYPATTFAAQTAGAVLPALVAPELRAAKTLGEILYGVAGGALTGAAASEKDRIEGAKTGAILGGALSGVLGGAKFAYDKTLKPLGSALYAWARPETAMQKRLIDTLIKDQNDIAAGRLQGIDWDQWTTLRDKGEPVTIADLGGPRTKALIQQLVKEDPEKALQIQKLFEDRLKTQYERVGRDIRYLTGTEANATKTGDQLLAEYDLKRSPYYRRAYSQPSAQAMWDETLEQLSQGDKFQNAIMLAFKTAKDHASLLGMPPPKIPFYKDATGRYVLKEGQIPNLQFWDTVKKNLDDLGTPEARQAAKALREHLDEIVPEYAEARGMAANYFKESNALEAGKKFAGKNISTEELKKTLRKLSPEELELFKEGFASDLSGRVIAKLDRDIDLNTAFYGSPLEQERILAIFGPEAAEKIKDRMAVESIYENSRKAFQIPSSAYKQLLQMGLSGGAGGTLASYEAGWSPMAFLAGAGAGAFFKAALFDELKKGAQAGVKYLNKPTSESLVRLLTSDDPADMRRAYDLIAQNPQYRNLLSKVATAVSRATKLTLSQKSELAQEDKRKQGDYANWLRSGYSLRSTGGSVTDKMHMAKGGFVRWTPYDKTWNSLNSYQKAAVMSLMEADRANPEDAKNILGAMVNRATRSKQDLGKHVSQAIYQPTFEPSQRARLGKLLQHPAMPELTAWAQRRAQGLEPDNVGGATHYLAHEPVMLALQRKNPRKYRSWVKWTQFNPETKTYGNVTMRDKSHAFLAPEGKYSAPYVAPQQVAGEIPPILQSQTKDDRARLAQMTAAAAQPQGPTPEDQAAMTDLVKETATPAPRKRLEDLPPEEQTKFLQSFKALFDKQQEAPVAPLPQAPKPEIPIVRPYGMAEGGGVPDLPGGSVEDYLYMPEMEQGSPIQGSMAPKEANISGNLRGSLGPISGNIGGYAFKSGPMKGADISNIGIQYNPDEDTTFSGEYFKEGDQGFGVMGRGSIRYAIGGTVTDRMHQARKKKVDGGAATNDDMTWGDVAEQYKKNIGPDVEKQATNYLLDQYKAFKDPLGKIKEATEPLQRAYEDPVGTLKGAAQGAYNLGKGAVDIGVGAGSKALGYLGYEPTGDVKYHREQPLEQAIQGVKKYIAENPASATMMATPAALSAAGLGKKFLTSNLGRQILADERGSLTLGRPAGIGHNMPPEAIETQKRTLKEGLYSALDESFNQTDRKRGNPMAWRNEFKRQGVSDKEMQWRGLDEFLASKPGNKDITREELQNFLKEKQMAPTSFVKEELLYADENGVETTSQYIRNRPAGGKKYIERVTKLDENFLPKNRDWFRAGGPHPDTGVDKPLGWTLEETYNDLLNRGEGQVIHEIQSPFGQKLANQKVINQQEHDALKKRASEMDKYIDERGDFIDKYRDVPYDLEGLPEQLKQDIELFFRTANPIMEKILKQKESVEFSKKRLMENPNNERLKEVLRWDEAGLKQYEDMYEPYKKNFDTYFAPHLGEKKITLKEIRDFDDFLLARAELDSELKQHPSTPAPFLDVNSGFNTLFQKSLIDAAKSGKEWLAISGPQRIKQRWGKDTTATMYERKTKDILRKLAKEHDPKAQIEEFYPHYQFADEPEISQKDWKAQYGEPYYGIRITPEMRKSILEKGFKMMSEGGSVTEKMLWRKKHSKKH